MRASLICLMVCATACAGRNEPPRAAPSSLAVDVGRDVILLPDGACPGYDGWFAMSENAVRQLRTNEIEAAARCGQMIVVSDGARRIAEHQRDDAIKALDKASWWRTHGPMLLGTASAIAATVGGVLGFELGRR